MFKGYVVINRKSKQIGTVTHEENGIVHFKWKKHGWVEFVTGSVGDVQKEFDAEFISYEKEFNEV